MTSIDGDVLPFLTEVEGARIVGAKVSVVGRPELSVVTGADAHFHFDGIEVGSDVTLEVEHPEYKRTRSASVRVGPKGIASFALQVVPVALFSGLASLVPLPVEEERFCVLATTVARMGGSLFVRLRQGTAGVTVALDPPAPAESGPIYFDESALPAAGLAATTIDGGALFYRVPPGRYVMSASKPDAAFNTVSFECVPGVIVNAGPPMGLLANVPAPEYGAGRDRPTDSDSAVTDALCEATAACVNLKASATNYPAATIASCKAMFRDVWSFVDPACDTSRGLRDAAHALYACRAISCDLALGGDEACASQEADFRAAEAAYGACVLAAP